MDLCVHRLIQAVPSRKMLSPSLGSKTCTKVRNYRLCVNNGFWNITIAGFYTRFILKIFAQFTAENVLTLKKPSSRLLVGPTYITACDYCENSYIQSTPLQFIVVDIYYRDLYLPASTLCTQTKLFGSVQGTGCLPENKNGKKWLISCMIKTKLNHVYKFCLLSSALFVHFYFFRLQQRSCYVILTYTWLKCLTTSFSQRVERTE